MPIHDWARVDDGIFHAFHVNWTVELAKALNSGVLPEDYYALPEQVAGQIHPDVLTLHAPSTAEREHAGTGQENSGGGVATLAPPAATQVMTMTAPTYDQLARQITIRHVSDDRIVSLVELVSRSNKSTIEAIGLLLNKTCNALRLGIHVLLVDLTPPGRRDPHGLHALVWESLGGEPVEHDPCWPLAAVAYEALGRADDAEQLRAYIEPLAIGAAIPDVPVFLEPGRHVQTPLESTYQTAFASLPARWRRVLEA